MWVLLWLRRRQDSRWQLPDGTLRDTSARPGTSLDRPAGEGWGWILHVRLEASVCCVKEIFEGPWLLDVRLEASDCSDSDVCAPVFKEGGTQIKSVWF